MQRDGLGKIRCRDVLLSEGERPSTDALAVVLDTRKGQEEMRDGSVVGFVRYLVLGQFVSLLGERFDIVSLSTSDSTPRVVTHSTHHDTSKVAENPILLPSPAKVVSLGLDRGITPIPIFLPELSTDSSKP